MSDPIDRQEVLSKLHEYFDSMNEGEERVEKVWKQVKEGKDAENGKDVRQ